MRWTEPSLPGLPRASRAPLAIAAILLALGAATSGCRHEPPEDRVPIRILHEPAALYSTEPGDTLERVAAWHGVDPAELAYLNHLEPDAPLVPGQALVVPQRPLATYTVKPGDTLGGLAAAFGVEVDALTHLNGVTDPRHLGAGAVLRIPANAVRTEVPAPQRATHEPTSAAVAAPRPPQNQTDEELAAARTAFDAAEFESALAWADRARQSVRASSQDPADLRRLAQAHLVRGMAEVALGRDGAARASFGQALDLDRTIDLDPHETSPKVLSVFREVRGR
jgi:LysM repeat protein